MTRRDFIRTLIGKQARPKVDVTTMDDKTLWALHTESYDQYTLACKAGKWSKADYYWSVFAKAKQELRYVRKLY